MIVEELIQFDREKLRPEKSLAQRFVLIQELFAAVPVSPAKLSLFIDELKRRQAEEQPFLFSGFGTILTAFLLITVVGSFWSVTLSRMLYFLIPAWSGLYLYRICAGKAKKYARLLEVLIQYQLWH